MKQAYVGFTQGFWTESLALMNNKGEYIFYPKGFEPTIVETDNIAFYEKPFLKRTRQFYSGQYRKAFESLNLKLKPKYYLSHHLCHAANAFQNSDFDSANIVVADSIGEWETVTVWKAYYINGYARYKKVSSRIYPFSLGLFYSSVTQLVGLIPNQDENKFMELSKLGTPDSQLELLMESQLLYRNNHRGCRGLYSGYNKEDLAHNTQTVLESYLLPLFDKKNNNCFSGGVAFNKLFVDKLLTKGYTLYVPNNPGDPGSAIGAAALLYGKKIGQLAQLNRASRYEREG